MNTSLRILFLLLVVGSLSLQAQDAPVFPAPQCPATPQGLVSYWNFDEGLGLAIDQGDGNDGMLGTSTTRVPGIEGSGAVSFDNTAGAYIDVGAGVNNDFSFTTGMTVAAIIKPQWSGAFLDYDEIFRKDDGNNRIIFSFQNDNGIGGGTGPVLSFGINIGGVYDELDMELDGQNGRPTLAQLEDGNPHYVVATYDSSSGLKAIYVDGTLRDSISYPAGTLMASGGPCSAAIGNFSCGYFQEPFTGTIDEVRVYNRALTAGETQCLQFTTVLADIKSNLAQRSIDNPGIAEALYRILNAAARSASFGNNGAAANQLNAAILFVRAQQAKHIDQTAAQRLLSELALLIRLAHR